MNIYILHGAYGNPQENWIPWLKDKLSTETVVTPTFPTPENQSFENWKKAMPEFSQEDILIGHSLAVPFILKLLEHKKAKACFLISGFFTSLGNETFDSINKSFYFKPEWQAIKQHCSNFIVFHSDNDPYVPLKQAQEIANNLDTKLILVEGAGHFNEAAGYSAFPELLEKIKELTKEA